MTNRTPPAPSQSSPIPVLNQPADVRPEPTASVHRTAPIPMLYIAAATAAIAVM